MTGAPLKRLKRGIAALGCAIACTLVFVVPAGAQIAIASQWVTFNTPVRLPGVALGAGTYLFERLPSQTRQRLVRVTRKEGNIVVGIFRVAPPDTPATGGPELTLWETGPGAAPAVKAVYLGTGGDGYEFVYSQEQRLAMRREPAAGLTARK